MLLLALYGLFGVAGDAALAFIMSFVAGADEPVAWREDGGELARISLIFILSLGCSDDLAVLGQIVIAM